MFYLVSFKSFKLYKLFSDDEFVSEVPRMGSAASKPSCHPILGDRKFPPFNEGPLSTIEKLPSKKKHGIINNKVRLDVKVVQPGHYGKGINRHWAQMVQSKDLKSSTSLTVVGNRSTFSLEMFLPWEKIPYDFSKGPAPGDYLIPSSWAKFKVIY